MNGMSNTNIILEFARQIGKSYNAAMYCDDKTDGNKKWYLPALGELNIMYNHFEAIQDGLKLVPDASVVLSSDPYWSSTRASNFVLIINFSNGVVATNYNKTYKYRARCFAHF